MKVLMVDVGGTNVKLMASGHEGRLKIPSGSEFKPAQMVKEIFKELEENEWTFDAVSLGLPCLVTDGTPTREPLALGGGWLRYDYEKAFGKPVKIINDACMQALGSYDEGRMLFVGFGTGTGSALIVDDVLIPMEIGGLLLSDGKTFMGRLSDEARKKGDEEDWQEGVHEAIELLRDVFNPDDIVLGGGNSKKIDPLPKGCRQKDNQLAFKGAVRLWPGADMLAEPYGTSWRIKKSKEKAAASSPKK